MCNPEIEKIQFCKPNPEDAVLKAYSHVRSVNHCNISRFPSLEDYDLDSLNNYQFSIVIWYQCTNYDYGRWTVTMERKENCEWSAKKANMQY